MCDLIEDTDPQIFDDAVPQQVGQIDKGVLEDAGGDQDHRKKDTHAGQSFRFGDNDVFVDNHIDQVGLQGIEWCQDDGEQGTEQQELSVRCSKLKQPDQQVPVEALFVFRILLAQSGGRIIVRT